MKSKSVHTGQTANINKTMALKGSKTYNALLQQIVHKYFMLNVSWLNNFVHHKNNKKIKLIVCWMHFLKEQRKK